MGSINGNNYNQMCPVSHQAVQVFDPLLHSELLPVNDACGFSSMNSYFQALKVHLRGLWQR